VIASLEQEVNELTSERDEAIRDKKTAEQDLLATANRLKNKSQEAEAKAQQIELLKREKSQSEIALNKTITELRTKYSKQSQLLDQEQTENNKLTEKIETLERQIQELKK
jgi:chromosome segregation ATPase